MKTPQLKIKSRKQIPGHKQKVNNIAILVASSTPLLLSPITGTIDCCHKERGELTLGTETGINLKGIVLKLSVVYWTMDQTVYKTLR